RPPHAVGKEDPRMDPVAGGGCRGHGRVERSLRARRPGPELVLRDLLGAGPLRPALGARASDLRNRQIHELGEFGAEMGCPGLSAPLFGLARSITLHYKVICTML